MPLRPLSDSPEGEGFLDSRSINFIYYLAMYYWFYLLFNYVLFIDFIYYLAMYYLLFIYYLVDVLFSSINDRMVNSKYKKNSK